MLFRSITASSLAGPTAKAFGWYLNTHSNVNINQLDPSTLNALTIQAPSIQVDQFTLKPQTSWSVGSQPGLNLVATGSDGVGAIAIQNADLKFKTSGTGDVVRLKAASGNLTISNSSLSSDAGTFDLSGYSTTLTGTTLSSSGGSLKLGGVQSLNISGSSLRATGGTITISGGDVSIGAATGRTLLLAGGGGLDDTNSDPSKHESKLANLTLLDGGTGSSSTPAISVNGGAGKTVQIFSGDGSMNDSSST